MLSLVSDLLTQVIINYFQLFMTSTNNCTAVLLWKFGEFFWTFLKPLTEFGMMGWYIKLSHLEVLAGDLFWVLCFSWCMSMILAVDYHQQPNVLLMIHHFFQWSMMSAIFQWIKWWSWENFKLGLPQENVL